MRFLQRVCPRYGNWGGPGWSGGEFPATPEDTDWSVGTEDSLDAFFKQHDRSYQNSIKSFKDGSITKAEMYDLQEIADVILVRNVGGMSMNPLNWTRPPKGWLHVLYGAVYRKLVLYSFYPKIWIM